MRKSRMQNLQSHVSRHSRFLAVSAPPTRRCTVAVVGSTAVADSMVVAGFTAVVFAAIRTVASA